MPTIIDTLLGIISYIVAFISMGVVVGFSPVVYGVFASTLTIKNAHSAALQRSLISGVFMAALLLIVSGTLIETILDRILSSVAYSILVGFIGIAILVYALRRQYRKNIAAQKSSKSLSPITVATIGFTKTILSTSSIAVALVTSTSFATLEPGFITHTILILALCIGAIAPFLIVMKSHRLKGRIRSWTHTIRHIIVTLHDHYASIVTFFLFISGTLLILYALSVLF